VRGLLYIFLFSASGVGILQESSRLLVGKVAGYLLAK